MGFTLSSHLSSARCSRICAAPLRTLRTGSCRTSSRVVRGAGTAARAGGDSEAVPPVQQMSYDDALKVLGLSGPSSFEQIVTAKNKQLAASQSNQEKIMEVETAYDVLFMQSMKKRMTGDIEVPTSVRFADVPTRKRSSSRSSAAQPSLLQKLPGGVAVAAPKQSVAAGQAAVFAGLGGWALVQAVLETPDAQAADTAGLQVAAAVAFAVYGFREYKKLSLGRSIGLSVGALTAGILLGAALNAWLRVDIVPLGSFSSPGVFVSTFGITALALASAFLA
eukprot:GHRQ01008175.1.p1 GENE.GHRQ01008175.1~~GHRQ01008175.1.p1  ORF type:complete len:279 (+),score=64.01 GHRQ01008175.1:188-1024(+)